MSKEQALALVASRKEQLRRVREAQTRASERFEVAVFGASGAGATQREIATRAAVSQPYVAKILGRIGGRAPGGGAGAPAAPSVVHDAS